MSATILTINGRDYKILHPYELTPICGFTSAGVPVAILLGSDGSQTVSTADGGNVALGAVADAAVTNPASSASVIGALKGILTEEVALVAKDFATQTTLLAMSAKLIADQSSTAPTNTATTPFTILTADGTVFTLAAGERGYIQNLDTDVLNYKLGASCSTTVLSGKLAACTSQDDATSPPLLIKNWIGVVSVAASTGSPRFTAWKI